VPHYEGPLGANSLQEAQQIVGYGGEIISSVWFVGAAVAPLIQGQDCEVASQEWCCEVPKAAIGRKAVQQHYQVSGPAPIAIMHTQPVYDDVIVGWVLAH
jgi:hypothetical protein